MNDSEKELREATVEARDYHPNVGVFELTANGAFEILGELDRLRALVAALDTAAEKKKHGHAGALRELENTRSRLSLAEKRIAELEGAREKAIGKPSAGFARDEEWLREVNSEVVGEAVSDTVEAIGDDIRVRLTSELVNLDRASPAQADPQPGTTPCAK